MAKIVYRNQEFDADAAVNLMDDELREELHSARDWNSEQEFFDAYCIAHSERFNATFTLN